MPPSAPNQHPTDCRKWQSQHRGNSFSSDPVRDVQASDFFHGRFVQNRIPASFTFGHSTLDIAVQIVVGFCPAKKVIRTDASAIITSMEHTWLVFGNCSEVQNPCNSMSPIKQSSACVKKQTVTSTINRTNPNPAAFVISEDEYVPHESLQQRHWHGAALTSQSHHNELFQSTTAPWRRSPTRSRRRAGTT